jgi:hypothetical protein
MARPPRRARAYRNAAHQANAQKKYARVAGKIALQRLLRQLPDDMRKEIAEAMRRAGPKALAIARSLAPSRSGKLRQLLDWKVSGGKVPRLRVGLLTKRAQAEGFYGRILEGGRKPGRAKASRRTPGGGISTYFINVRGISRGRYDFIFDSAKPRIQNEVFGEVGKVVDDVLARAGRGDLGGSGNGD